jgi:hypothetical protein
MPRRKKVKDEQEARRFLLAVEAEGGDIRSWARAHGVDGRSLQAWRVNLARWGTKAPRLHRRRPRTARAAPMSGVVELLPTATASGTGRYVLEIGGARIELGDNFCESTLRRLVGVLRSC